MINLLFVCLGNICRSPMAEAILRKKLKDQGLHLLIKVDSAGTGDWHIGKTPHKGTQLILKKHGISAKGIKARQLCVDDIKKFDYIIAMDSSNYHDILELAESCDDHGQIFRLLDLEPSCLLKDVPDPYFTGKFDEVYDQLNRSCDQLIHWVIKNKNL